MTSQRSKNCKGCRTFNYIRDEKNSVHPPAFDLRCAAENEDTCPCEECLIKTTCFEKPQCPEFNIVMLRRSSALT